MRYRISYYNNRHYHSKNPSIILNDQDKMTRFISDLAKDHRNITILVETKYNKTRYRTDAHWYQMKKITIDAHGVSTTEWLGKFKQFHETQI